MNSVEYVPTHTPNRRANTNPRIDAPPKMKIATNVTIVDNDVLNVRRNVEFKAASVVLVKSRFGYRPMYSRILSNTTTVSLIEYPTIVKIAAMNDWSISIENGMILPNNEKIPNNTIVL